MIHDRKFPRSAYEEIQSKLMQFQSRIRWKTRGVFATIVLILSFLDLPDKKENEARFFKESNYCRSLITSCNIDKQSQTKD